MKVSQLIMLMIKINIFIDYQETFQKCLSDTQIETFKILVWLLQVHKNVKIERLAANFPLPILYESRRKHIQRFLNSTGMSVSALWMPIIQSIINHYVKVGSKLILIIDRTQWRDNNLLMVSILWRRRSLPIFWLLLDNIGASSLQKQQAVIRPVIKLFRNYNLFIIGDREFHSVELAFWLKNNYKDLKFAFRFKQDTNIKRGKEKYYPLSDLNLYPGMRLFFPNTKVTKNKGFGRYNVAICWKRKYKSKQLKEPWCILTNINDLKSVIELYSKRIGIEAMFKDCKTGGYNLEGSYANTQRLTSLILLIAIAYTIASLKGQYWQDVRNQKYISRLTEENRKVKRHSSFWIGLYGLSWIISHEFCLEFVNKLIKHNRNKLNFYNQGRSALNIIKSDSI